MIRIVGCACPNITKCYNAPSFQRRKGTHLKVFATPILNSCQHAARAETTDQVCEAIGPEIIPIVAIFRRRERYPYSLRIPRRNCPKRGRAQNAESGGFAERLHSYVFRHVSVDKKVRTVNGYTKRYDLCCEKWFESVTTLVRSTVSGAF